jgi:glycosyltransferase involved in cell wall biosynthesis
MDDEMIMENPKVSMIIPTYNSGGTLTQCLESVESQSYSPIEVIIVDNFSSDDTLRIARDHEVSVLQQNSTPALARNIGVANATGRYVFFVDSDQILSSSLVRECVEICEIQNVDIVGVPEIFLGMAFWASCSAAWKNHYSKIGQESPGQKILSSGEPRFFAKERLTQVGMSDSTLLWGEDQDLHERLRSIGIKETVCVSKLYHYEPNSIRGMIVKNLRYGKSLPTFMQRSEKKRARSEVLAPFLMHSLLTLKSILGDTDEKPVVVVGSTLLLGLKTFAMSVGLLTA